jgi:hypothetical protein
MTCEYKGFIVPYRQPWKPLNTQWQWPNVIKALLKTSVALVRERTIPTERPPLVSEVSANSCCQRVSRGQCNGSLMLYSRLSRLKPLLFLTIISATVLTRLGALRSRTSKSQNICNAGNRTRDLWICSQELWPVVVRRKVESSRPDEVNFFNLSNPSGRTRPWGLLSL